MELGRIGIWSSPLRRGGEVEATAAAAEIERLGFATAWMPGGEAGLPDRVAAVLGATTRLILATGIVNIWVHQAAETSEIYGASLSRGGGRLMVGVGVGHEPLVNKMTPGLFGPPIQSMDRYLDRLDDGPPPVPKKDRLIGALGPRMMHLARERAAGAHPYLTTPEHTRWARGVLGAEALLAPEQHVILEENPSAARARAREWMGTYLSLPNYIHNFRRMGFTDADLEDGGSDRIIDGLVAWGDVGTVLKRVQEHIDAGADHVAIQVLGAERLEFPIAGWRAIAEAIRN